jgi:hypothetical protein
VPPSPETPPISTAPEADTGEPENYTTISEDTTWSGRVVMSGVVTVSPHATLTIEPGTDVVVVPGKKGTAGAVLSVQGRLWVRGTADRPIRFLLENGTGRKSAWQGIVLLGSGKKNSLEHCRIEGADVGLDVIYSSVSLKNALFNNCRIGLRSQGGLLLATGGGATNCETGIILHNSEADCRGNTLEANRLGLSAVATSLHLESAAFTSNTSLAFAGDNSKLAIYRCTFSKNGSGLIITSSEGAMEGSRVVSSQDFGMRLTDSRMRISGNTVSLNTGVGIFVNGKNSVFWGNNITLNGLYNMYNEGADDVSAVGNWWGFSTISRIKKSIFDKTVNPGRGILLILPVLRGEIEIPDRQVP